MPPTRGLGTAVGPAPKRRPDGRQAMKYLDALMARPELFGGFLKATKFYGSICTRY